MGSKSGVWQKEAIRYKKSKEETFHSSNSLQNIYTTYTNEVSD